MATTPPFKYQPMFEKGKDTTEYYLLTKDYVSVSEFEGKPILKIEKEGLTAMANAAFRDVSFMLRRSHNEQVAKILSDPEASDNDKYVALTFLRNAEVASKGVLPFCQDTGTAIIHGEKGQQVWTGYCDEEALSLGVYKTYTEENLRYSQNAPLTMYDEVFHHVITRGPHKGEVRGFAWAGMCAVNRDCKIPPVRKYNAALSPDTVSYVGIAEDEPKRLARLDGVKKVSLLAKYGMTETDAYKLCTEHGLLSPIYTHCRRNGCWFCPNASDSELLHMVTKHPEMFDRLIEWENEDNIFHRRMTRRETPSDVKARLLSKSQMGFSSPKSK